MAEKRKIGGVTVNDGHGLLDNEGLIESMIIDVNDLMKCMAAGQYIRYADITIKMVQKLKNLKKSMKEELIDRENQIEELKHLNNELAEKAFGIPIDKEDIPVEESERATEGKENGTD